MIGFCPLSSSSHGNSIYLRTPKSKVLIDCGLSGKRTRESLAAIDVDYRELDAIFLTHEHGDHIKGVKVLGFKESIPLFANIGTAKSIVHQIAVCPQFKIFTTGESFAFQDLWITPFSIPHDCSDPVAFTIECEGMKLGFCTDLGHVTPLVRHHLQGCDHLYVEANHEPELVELCSRPWNYKTRVQGHYGHLSNEACGELIKEVYSDKLKRVVLAHLSSECNDPKLAFSKVETALKEQQIELELSVANLRELSPFIPF